MLRFLAFLLLFFPLAAFAQDTNEARPVLEKSVNLILEDIKNPDFAQPKEREKIISQIENTVRNIFDFTEFSSRTVGPRWKTFSASEKENFSNAFAKLLLNTYLNKITGYNGEQISWTGEVISEDGKRAEVRTLISMKDGKKIPVFYRMLPKDGTWRVYDVIIENISLVKNYRTQFQDILNTDSPAALIEKVNNKAEEIIKQKAG